MKVLIIVFSIVLAWLALAALCSIVATRPRANPRPRDRYPPPYPPDGEDAS